MSQSTGSAGSPGMSETERLLLTLATGQQQLVSAIRDALCSSLAPIAPSRKAALGQLLDQIDANCDRAARWLRLRRELIDLGHIAYPAHSTNVALVSLVSESEQASYPSAESQQRVLDVY